eukprot:7443242-Heterocapsa_arctica.AAC.1
MAIGRGGPHGGYEARAFAQPDAYGGGGQPPSGGGGGRDDHGAGQGGPPGGNWQGGSGGGSGGQQPGDRKRANEDPSQSCGACVSFYVSADSSPTGHGVRESVRRL